MKCSFSIVMAMIMIVVLVPCLVSSRHVSRSHLHRDYERHNPKNNHDKTKGDNAAVIRKGADTVQVAGSRLPDCTHACGSCRPCRLVMVSFVCASLEEAETCPMAYKCMCKNKSYPVP